MKLELLEDLYLEELKDLYDAEKQLLKALPKMAGAASSSELQEAFKKHTAQTQKQVERLDQIFKDRGQSAAGKTCKAMKGLIAEAKELLNGDVDPEMLDVGLIAAAQKVEHYEIAGYGCTTNYARLLGLEEEARLLHQTLEEEKSTDGKLTVLAEAIVNEEAAQGEIPGGEDLTEGVEMPGMQDRGPGKGQGRESKSASSNAGGADRTTFTRAKH
jgi:ferritin-like metal-binding protein YciE